MNDCKRYQNLFVNYLFDEIEESEKKSLEAHLARCSRCTSEVTEMRGTLEMMGRKAKVKPPEAYWDSYWSRLSARMEKELRLKPRRKIPLWERVRGSVPVIPAPAYRWAAVAAALVLGILIGRFLVTTDGVKEMPVARHPLYQDEGTYLLTVDDRAEKYLEKSKIFLLGFVNTNGELEAGDFDLGRQREISQDLIHEASYLKENMKEHSQQRLVTLIEELETILIEIANLEEMEDVPDVELIRDGIDRKGILLKINIHQMKGGVEGETLESNRKRKETLI